MGEFAEYQGQRIEIGTCENLYYLRADQALKVTPVAGGVNPVTDAAEVRFRFPWPDEDEIEPGMFDDYDRSLPLRGVKAPDELADNHSSVQFKAAGDYLCSLPCPESGNTLDGHLRFQLNGYIAGVFLCQQRWWNGLLVGVLRCGACGMRWRLETLQEAQPAIDALEAEAQRHRSEDRGDDHFYVTVAQRLRAGYSPTVLAPQNERAQ